jgi:hypothetical protein
MAALADSYAVLERARRDLEALQEKTRGIVPSRPAETVLQPDEKDEMCGVFVEPPFEADPDWGIDFGVIAGHLRSALDYIPAYLANPGKAELSKTAFPVSKCEADYLRLNHKGVPYRDRALVGVPEDLWPVFEEQQPYRRGDDPRDGPLAVLGWITNYHKHRKLHPALITVAQADFPMFFNGEHLITVTISKGARVGLDAKTQLFAFGVTPVSGFTIGLPEEPPDGTTVKITTLGPLPEGETNIQVKGKFGAEIAFGDRSIRVADLWPIIDRVQEIVDVFEPLAPVVT